MLGFFTHTHTHTAHYKEKKDKKKSCKKGEFFSTQLLPSLYYPTLQLQQLNSHYILLY